ncbi:MAG: hypothetical protein WAW03_09610, partial [Anaerolineae bacterium]
CKPVRRTLKSKRTPSPRTRLAAHDRPRVLPVKLALDLAYLARRTVASDLKLILRTIAAVFD